MRKSPFLTNGAFVVNFPNSANQTIVKRHLTNPKSFFFRLFGLVPGFEADLICPPMVKRGDGQYGHVVPLYKIGIFRRDFRQFLDEGKDVDTLLAPAQFGKQWLGTVQKFVTVPVNMCNTTHAPLDLDVSGTKIHSRRSDLLVNRKNWVDHKLLKDLLSSIKNAVRFWQVANRRHHT